MSPCRRSPPETGEASGPPAAASRRLEARPLELGVPRTSEWRGGTEVYRTALSAGDYLRLVVDQQGVDLVVALTDPRGQELLEVDSPNGAHGPETVFAVAETTGDHFIELCGWNETVGGAYTVRVEASRPATDRDRRLAAAARAAADADRLMGQDRADALEHAAERYEEALAVWEDAGESTQEALAHQGLGRARFRQGEV